MHFIPPDLYFPLVQTSQTDTASNNIICNLCVANSHEAAHHLFGVFRASGVCKADERAVDCDPGAPLQLKHKHTG